MVSSSKVEYVQTGQLIVANYVKNTKAIGFLWGVFSICYAIITLLVFFQPQWIGNTSTTGPGYFNSWKHCAISSSSTESTATSQPHCRGRLDDFSTIPNSPLKIATVLVGLSSLVACLSVFALILFVCAPTALAYHIVAWMQTIAAFCASIGLLVFPLGWDSAQVRLTCGPTADRYSFGSCGMRWGFVLGILGVLDGCVLAILGFVLGSHHVKLSPAEGKAKSKARTTSSYLPSGLYPTETTGAPPSSIAISHHDQIHHKSHHHDQIHQKRPLNLQPILLIPPEIDGYSDFSRSKQSLYKAEYATPSQQFQL